MKFIKKIKNNLKFTVIFLFLFCFLTPRLTLAASSEEARTNLIQIYNTRPDLQQLFDANTWQAKVKSFKLANLEVWAKSYGVREYPIELKWYGQKTNQPKALKINTNKKIPIRVSNQVFDFSAISAKAVIVIDKSSRRVLLEENADDQRSLASITKLMTALVLRDKKLPNNTKTKMIKKDEVGGARLRLAVGTSVTNMDLFFAMLVGSANNAANALPRTTGIGTKSFVTLMNNKAKTMGLTSKFVDTSGINPKNLASARDAAALGLAAFSDPLIRRATTTATYEVKAYPVKTIAAKGGKKAKVVSLPMVVHPIKNTNSLLLNENNGLLVLGGKTGYLDEAGWNLVVELDTDDAPPLLIVVLGSSSRAQSFVDVEALAKFTWGNYRWE